MENKSGGIKIIIAENADDINRSSEIFCEYIQNKKGWKKTALTAANVLWVASIVFTAAIAVLGIITDSVLAVFGYVLSAVLFTVIYIWYVRNVKKGRKAQPESIKKARMVEYANGFHTVSYSFGEENITVENKYRTSSIGYKNISAAVEFAEGIFLVQNPLFDRAVWIPAKFVSADNAEKLKNILKDNLGKKYDTVSPLCAPENSVKVQPDSRIQPKSEKLMTLISKPDKGKNTMDVIKLVLSSSKRSVLYLVFLFIALSCAGFFRQMVSFIKLVFKVIGLVKNYMETGTIGTDSEIAATVMSLLITAVGFLIMIVIIIFIAVVSANLITSIVNALKANRAVKEIAENDQTVEIYDDIIVGTTALGNYATPWSDVNKAVRKNGQVQIHDCRMRYIPVSIDDIGEQKDEFFELLSSRLGKGWHKPQQKVLLPEPEKKTVYDAPDYDSDDQ